MNDISLNINIPTLILITITLLITGVFSFLIGYLLGRNGGDNGVYNVVKKSKINNQNNPVASSISIDEAKVVSNIKTDDLSKKYDSLGEIKESTENITNSINKLKNLKK